MTTPAPSANPSPDITKLKTYLINLISRELEANPPVPEKRRQAVMETLNLAYQSTKLQLANT
ncbi:MAG: CpaF family protein, partial [Anaerolineaceae bacterium]|nr:CpaF family protein [Anaerolineaceae bacterium]